MLKTYLFKERNYDNIRYINFFFILKKVIFFAGNFLSCHSWSPAESHSVSAYQSSHMWHIVDQLQQEFHSIIKLEISPSVKKGNIGLDALYCPKKLLFNPIFLPQYFVQLLKCYLPYLQFLSKHLIDIILIKKSCHAEKV